MKVAFISYDFAEYSIQHANGLAGECDVLLMLPADSAAEYEPLLDRAVRYRPFDSPRLRQPLRQVFTAAAIVREIRRFRPDVIHFQHGHLWFNFVLPTLRSFPLVITIHNPRHHTGDRASRKTPQWLMDFGFRRADRVIVHGESLKREVVRELGIPAGKVHVVPHIAFGQEAAACEPEADEKRILFFGRIWKYKGLEYLIQAQAAITRAMPGAKIVIAGQGEDFEPYRQMMAEPDRFEVHNRYITAAERHELFCGASVVVLPYIEATQSGVVPFAYSYAKPVVATRVGAIPDAVDDGITGIMIPPRDPAALADSVIGLLQNPARSKTIGAAGRARLDRECAPHVVGRQTIEVYRQAITDRAAAREASPIPRPATSSN
jgi:glycosyltransferase involved in cell wall biosynthesis